MVIVPCRSTSQTANQAKKYVYINMIMNMHHFMFIYVLHVLVVDLFLLRSVYSSLPNSFNLSNATLVQLNEAVASIH